MSDLRKKKFHDFVKKYHEFLNSLIEVIPDIEKDQETCRMLLFMKKHLIEKIEDKFAKEINGEK